MRAQTTRYKRRSSGTFASPKQERNVVFGGIIGKAEPLRSQSRASSRPNGFLAHPNADPGTL